MRLMTYVQIIVGGVATLAYFLHEPIPDGFSNPMRLRAELAAGKILIFVAGLADRTGVASFGDVTLSLYHAVIPKATLDDTITVWESKLDGVSVRMYSSSEETGGPSPALVYFHGGGWVSGAPDWYDKMLGEVVHKLHIVVISVDYRLAPKATFPLPLEDCLKVTRHVLTDGEALGVDVTKVAIGGDSAGGNLAAAVALKLRDEKFPQQPRVQLLIYPILQAIDFQLPSYQQNQYGPLTTRTGLMWYWSMYLAGNNSWAPLFYSNQHVTKAVRERHASTTVRHDSIAHDYRYSPYNKPALGEDGEGIISMAVQNLVVNPYVSPLLADDLSALPEACVITMQSDVLRDEGLLYAQRLEEAKVKVTVTNLRTGVHGLCSHEPPHKETHVCRHYLKVCLEKTLLK